MKAEIGKQSLEWHVGTTGAGGGREYSAFFQSPENSLLCILKFFSGGGAGKSDDIHNVKSWEIRSEVFSTFFIFPETCPVSSVSGNHFLGETIQ